MKAPLNGSLRSGGFAAAVLVLASGCGAEDKAPLETQEEKLGYSMGVIFGERIQQDMEDLDRETFLRGVVDGLEGNEKQLSDEQIQSSLQTFQQQQAENRRSQQGQQAQNPAQQGDTTSEGAAQENLEKAESFLEENGQRGAVTTTDSGLQYEILENGDGPSPDASDRVTVHYTGTLIDETVFDSSREREEPATFGLQQVIPGWTEGLQLMREGGRYRFYIHPELAYGESGPPSIGPNRALIFDVELIEVK